LVVPSEKISVCLGKIRQNGIVLYTKKLKKAKFPTGNFAFLFQNKLLPAEKVGAVAKSIENALGKAVLVLIGFLASLLGIGGLADKILGVIRKIRQGIENAIVKFWTFVKGKAK